MVNNGSITLPRPARQPYAINKHQNDYGGNEDKNDQGKE